MWPRFTARCKLKSSCCPSRWLDALDTASLARHGIWIGTAVVLRFVFTPACRTDVQRKKKRGGCSYAMFCVTGDAMSWPAIDRRPRFCRTSSPAPPLLARSMTHLAPVARARFIWRQTKPQTPDEMISSDPGVSEHQPSFVVRVPGRGTWTTRRKP